MELNVKFLNALKGPFLNGYPILKIIRAKVNVKIATIDVKIVWDRAKQIVSYVNLDICCIQIIHVLNVRK